MTNPPTDQSTPKELQMLQDLNNKNREKSATVTRMEDMIEGFDIQYVLDLNVRLRDYYAKIGDRDMIPLIDQMTETMRDLTEIINQVKVKRLTLEQGQREIHEKLEEISQVLQTLKEWEMTAL